MLHIYVFQHELPGPICMVRPTNRQRAPERPLLGPLGLQLGIVLHRQRRPCLLSRRKTLADSEQDVELAQILRHLQA
eukprot:4308599-Alexandrium_andersonii.AAC.1